MTQELAIISDNLPPAMFDLAIAAASEKAASLKRLVEQQKLYVQLGNNKHLRVEAWETIGRGYGYTAKSTISELYRNADGAIIGVKATATVVDQNGVSVGGADSVCFADEDGKASQSVAQLAGMAQTRAVSRAYKQMLSWVVVLAGYSATPAEEMHGELARQMAASSDRPDYLCQEHKTEWFKRGKMRSYAHPIGDSKEWCHMPAEATPVPVDSAVALGLADDVQAAPAPTQGAQARTAPQKAKEGECEFGASACAKTDRDFTDRGKIMSHFGSFHKVGIAEAQACFPLTPDGQRQTIQNLTIAQLLEACKKAAQHA